MTCTLGMTCAIGATFIAFTSPPRQSPASLPGRGTEGREIPDVSFLPHVR